MSSGRNNSQAFKKLRLSILRRDQYTCHYCGRYASTVDHLIPYSKGGPDVAENLVAACFDCNVSKGNKTLGQGGNWVNPRWR